MQVPFVRTFYIKKKFKRSPLDRKLQRYAKVHNNVVFCLLLQTFLLLSSLNFYIWQVLNSFIYYNNILDSWHLIYVYLNATNIDTLLPGDKISPLPQTFLKHEQSSVVGSQWHLLFVIFDRKLKPLVQSHLHSLSCLLVPLL